MPIFKRLAEVAGALIPAAELPFDEARAGGSIVGDSGFLDTARHERAVAFEAVDESVVGATRR